MTDFIKDESNEKDIDIIINSTINENMIIYSNQNIVTYCPTCTMPPEFCEHGSSFDLCLPWILKNCPDVLSETLLSKLLEKTSIDGDSNEVIAEELKKKKRGGGAAPLKKSILLETKIILSRIQRQKRKYVTVVTGLETVNDLKIKDAAKVFGRKFSSGSSINETQTGAKEVIIQGDVMFDLPNILIHEFKISPIAIYYLEDNGSLRCYQN